MDDTMVKMSVFLDSCYEVESTCAEMYFLFEQQFKDDSKVSRLWGKTAMEEENHARHVRLAKKMVESINWVCIESWHNVTTSLDMIKQFTKSVRESPPTLRDALLMALECENIMENLHMQNAILVKENAGNSMFRAMMKEDRGHIVMLQAALEEVKNTTDERDLKIFELEEIDPLDIIEYQQAAVT